MWYVFQLFRVIAIGIGDGVNRTEIRLMASQPIGDNMFIARNFDAALDSIVDSIFVTTCSGTYLSHLIAIESVRFSFQVRRKC